MKRKLIKKLLLFSVIFVFGTSSIKTIGVKAALNDSIYSGINGVWNTTEFDVNKDTNKTVFGDFDGDSKTDIAAFNDKDKIKFNVWLAKDTTFKYFSNNSWWDSTDKNSGRTTAVVAGNFDGKGSDDIAVLCDYNNGDTRIHLWTSEGTKFVYKGVCAWWNRTGDEANKKSGKIVVGNFDEVQGDDIVILYDYGNGQTKLYEWLANSNSLNIASPYDWVQTDISLNKNKVIGKVVDENYKEITQTKIATTFLNSVTGGQVVEYAKSFLGVPYVWGGESPSGFDCSGFIKYIYQHFGYSVKRIANDQKTCGAYVSRDSLQLGDLLFFDWQNDNNVDHVGIYIGDNQFIHAHGSEKNPDKVVIYNLTGVYSEHLITQRRLLN